MEKCESSDDTRNDDETDILVEHNPTPVSLFEYDIIDDNAVFTTAATCVGLPNINIISRPNGVLKRRLITKPIDRTIEEEKLIGRNTQEKIVICVDLSTCLKEQCYDNLSGVEMLKMAVNSFVYCKHRINESHEFALVILQDSSLWIRSFTNDPEEITTYLMDVIEGFTHCQTADLTSLFILLNDEVTLPRCDDTTTLKNVSHTIRILMIYSRQDCIPDIDHPLVEKFISSPVFFIDLLYLHGPLLPNNKCQEIYDKFQELDSRGSSYMFALPTLKSHEVCKAIGALLAHPLQRPVQNKFNVEVVSN